MVRGLIALKFSMLANSPSGLRRAGWAVGAGVVLATYAAAALSAGDVVRHGVLALVFALWLVGGVLGPVLVSGAGVLRADYFALLPISRRALGRGLLASVFVGVGAGYVLLGLLASVWHAVVLDPGTVVIAILGSVLAWVLVIALSRLTYGALGAAMRTRLGIEIAGVQWGIVLAALLAGWMMVTVAIQSIPVLLSDGLPAGPIMTVLNAFPTSWTLLAIEAAAVGDVAGAAGWLFALLVLDAACVAGTIALLVPRPQVASRGRGRPRSVGLVAGGGLLPATPTGAVVMKELRQWRRDPWRALEASTAVWTGAVIGVFALLGGYTAPAGAFAGVMVAVMVSLSGCNLYGQDGTAVWQNVVGESPWSVRADVHGRAWALVLVFLPRAALVSVVFVIGAQAWWAIPYVIAALPVTIGAAAGAAVLTSAIGVSPGVDPRRRVGANDANGNIALHVWIALIATSLGVAPTAAMIVWAAVSGSPWVIAAAAIFGVLNGFFAAWLLSRATIAYLDHGMVDVFSRIRYGRVFRDHTSGLLDQLAATTLKGEHEYSAAQQKDRERRLAKSRAARVGTS